MTSSVPYSFVPGSKAKAEEVNANFVAVLDEVEKSNVKISELDTQKMDKDLSNLDEQGQEILDAKAEKTELDGNWTNKGEFIIREVTLSKSYDKSFDLSSMLPDDENVYEVIVSAIIRTASQINSCFSLNLSSTLCGSIYICRAVTRVSNVNVVASGNCIIPIAKDRNIRIFVGDETNSSSYTNSCSVRISAYRKVR